MQHHFDRRAFTTMLALGALTPGVRAAAFPERTVRIIVPAGAGGLSDQNARALAAALSERWSHSIVVDNRAGGAGAIGAHAVATAPADGYTLLVSTIAEYCITPQLSKRFQDISANLTPVVLLSDTPLTLVASTSFGPSSVKELVEYAKSASAPLSFSTAGAGTLNHLAGMQFGLESGVPMLHVPYKSGAEAVLAVLSGQVPLSFSGVSVVKPQVDAGKLKVLGLASGQRLKSNPSWSTFVEQGMVGFTASNWVAVSAPRGTPADVVAQLNAAANQALASPQMRSILDTAGSTPVGGPVDVLAARTRDDLARYGKVIKATDIRIE